MREKLERVFRVFEIMAFERVAAIFFNYDENACDQQSTFYQTVLKFHM